MWHDDDDDLPWWKAIPLIVGVFVFMFAAVVVVAVTAGLLQWAMPHSWWIWLQHNVVGYTLVIGITAWLAWTFGDAHGKKRRN